MISPPLVPLAHRSVVLLLALAALASLSRAGSGSRESLAGVPARVQFGRDIRPLLSDRCFKCHGPDENTREAELRLDNEQGSRQVIVPGDPNASELFDRVSAVGEMWGMPPEGSGKQQLSVAERETLRRWIEQGANYEKHWAFELPVRPASGPDGTDPAVHPVDHFLRAKLEQANLPASPPADPATFLRRLFLELTGLPPTPEELDAFVAEPEAGRNQRWIDRIFRDEPYRSRHAERMATSWLDQARYADTSGIHMDAGRQIWPWRDWVLNAFRTNMPFDQFVVEQLAGDLLDEPTTDQLVATGFHRNQVTTDEGGAIDEEYLVEYAVDRTETTSAVLFGLTVGCARCHDHKYDPISQEDFYSLFAFFHSIDQPGLYSQVPDPQRALEPLLILPTDAQKAQEAALEAELQGLRASLEEMSAEDEQVWQEFQAELQSRHGPSWEPYEIREVRSAEGTPLSILDDGSVLAGGEAPAGDEYTIRLRTYASDVNALLLEALPDATAGDRIGRANNGNAVVEQFRVEATSVRDPRLRRPVRFTWVQSDYSQRGEDFSVTNLLDPENPRVWALGGHEQPGPRFALFLADQSFGYEGGTDLTVQMVARSQWHGHMPVRVRLTPGAVPSELRDRLPVVASYWQEAGPFAIEGDDGYDRDFGPETASSPYQEPDDGQLWNFRYLPGMQDGEPFALNNSGRQVTYLARLLHVPSARSLSVSLGSDDGFVLFLGGQRVAERRVDRGVAPEQDQVTLDLPAGESLLLFKIVNTGGPSGAYYLARRGESELPPDLVPLLLPAAARSAEHLPAARATWMRSFSPRFAASEMRITECASELESLRKSFPRTMIMKELATPRPVYLLRRGQYDQPDRDRPVQPRLPAILGEWPEELPRNRLGLARWIVSADNPLTARVVVNRLWQQLFGAGLVRTGSDFGLQGDWPSHKELLDWLAVEFRESGWDVQHLLRILLTSEAFARSSKVRPEVLAADPEGRLLAAFPSRRLEAEQLRDQALFLSGLLVEKLGGPSVKPYQPPDLWREVAMPQSNTRIFQRDEGENLWRRSLYTYWKRAAPPPSMLAFDAPTREFCTVQRGLTSTPLQALVLWNDEQFVEAARVLAERTLRGPAVDDAARLARLFRSCTSRIPELGERAALAAALADFRARYAADGAAAEALIAVGEAAPAPELQAAETAAWTLLASAVLNLHETTTLR